MHVLLKCAFFYAGILSITVVERFNLHLLAQVVKLGQHENGNRFWSYLRNPDVRTISIRLKFVKSNSEN